MARFGRTRDDAAGDRTTGARGRRAAAGAAGAVGSGVLLLARLIRLVATVLALVIGAGILLIVLSANAKNSIVSTVHDAAKGLVGPFDGMFTPHDHKLAIAINWGIALVVYLVVGAVLAGLVARFGTAARRRSAGSAP